MTALDLAALDLSARPTPAVDAIAMADPTQSAIALWPHANVATPTISIDEPSSLALALIGVVTLVAYRGVQARLAAMLASRTPRPATKPAQQPPAPHRRVA